MSTEQNKELCRRFFAAISSGDFAALDQILSPNFVEHELLPPQIPPGREGAKILFSMLRHAIPDAVMSPEDMVAEGDKVAVRVLVTGTQTGEFMGIPASGKLVEYTVMDLMRIQDSQLVEHWGVADQMTLLTQIGAMPAR